jgi:hypothetical protein
MDVEFAETPWHISISDSESDSKDLIKPKPSAREGVIILPMDNFDFVTMHNILYFIYTGRANLHFGPVKEQELPGYPDQADPFQLYRAAHLYGLQPLRDRCYRFLIDTRTPDNICSRLFHSKYPSQELMEEYINFLLEHYDEVKGKRDWEMLFSSRGRKSLMDDSNYRMHVVLQITRRLSFLKPV